MNLAKVVGRLGKEPDFDIMYWLKRQKLIGQLTHENDLAPDTVFGKYAGKVPGISPPIFGMMVPLNIAVEELRHNVTEGQLRRFCKDNNIFMGNWISNDKAAQEFQTFKEKVLKRRKNKPMDSVNEVLELANALGVSEGNVQGNLIEGSSGSVSVIDSKYDYIFFFSTPKQFTYAKNALLKFMELISYTITVADNSYSANFKMLQFPTPEQAEVIRNYAGLRKSRS